MRVPETRGGAPALPSDWDGDLGLSLPSDLQPAPGKNNSLESRSEFEKGEMFTPISFLQTLGLWQCLFPAHLPLSCYWREEVGAWLSQSLGSLLCTSFAHPERSRPQARICSKLRKTDNIPHALRNEETDSRCLVPPRASEGADYVCLSRATPSSPSTPSPSQAACNRKSSVL